MTHFSGSQIDYLQSRLRSDAENESFLLISCNPDPDHEWLMERVKWYLDDGGYPDPKKDGKVRWYVKRGGELFWGDSRQEVLRKYGKRDENGRLLPKKHKLQIKPLALRFIAATIYDNPVILETNPEYLSMLEGLPDVERARLLDGRKSSCCPAL